MKCKFCRAEIEHDAQFCTNCGKDLSIFDKCVKCGELLDSDTVFCPYCGTEQPRHEDLEDSEESSSYKKIFVAVLGVLLLGGLCYYLSSRSSIDNIGDTNKSIVETSVTKSKETYADDNSTKNSTETHEEVTTTQPEIEASVNETEKYISFKDILETNGDFKSLVKTHGFMTGYSDVFGNYVSLNMKVDSDGINLDGKNGVIISWKDEGQSLVCFINFDGEDSFVESFYNTFIRLAKKVGENKYEFIWPNGKVVRDVKYSYDMGGCYLEWDE